MDGTYETVTMVGAPLSRSHVNTRNAWIFFGITIIEATVNCALEGVLFYFLYSLLLSNIDMRKEPGIRTIPAYLAIYLLAFCFQVVSTYLAIRQRNTIQIWGLVIFNACFIAYSAVLEIPVDSPFMMDDPSYQTFIQSVTQKMHLIVIVIPVITGIAQIAYMYLAYKIYQDFGWIVFKRLGADRKIQRYYLYFEIFACLLKFDFFFFVGFSMQLLILVLIFTDVEAWLTLAAIPVSVVFIFLATWSVRHEIHWLQALFDVAIVTGAGYFGVKLYRIWGDQRFIYETDRKSLTVFASVGLALMVSTFIVSVVCQINFGKGLKKYLVPQKDRDEQTGFVEYGMVEETGYRSPRLSSSSKPKRVLLE